MIEGYRSTLQRSENTVKRQPQVTNLYVWCLHGFSLLLCLVMVFPLLWLVSTAFKLPEEVFARTLQMFPSQPTLQNFSDALNAYPVDRWLANSVFVAVAITLGKLMVSLPAAFVLARWRFRGRQLLFAMIVGTMIVPYIVTIVPNFILVSNLRWMNSVWGVIIPMTAFVGFNIFFLRQAMLTLPQDLFDAAAVDGANTWTMLTRIAIPLVRPSIVVVSVLSFILAWDLYLWPLLILGDTDSKTLSVGLQYFAVNQPAGEQAWGPLMAAALISMLPPLVIYLLAQRQIISAYVISGIKG
jgi:ABC-type glycerol-3-phosphate transport system permease component